MGREPVDAGRHRMGVLVGEPSAWWFDFRWVTIDVPEATGVAEGALAGGQSVEGRSGDFGKSSFRVVSEADGTRTLVLEIDQDRPTPYALTAREFRGVKIYPVNPPSIPLGDARNALSVAAVRRPDEARSNACRGLYRFGGPLQLALELVLVELERIAVRVQVVAQLVPFRDRPSEDVGVRAGDRAQHEERATRVVVAEHVEHHRRPLRGPVVERQGNDPAPEISAWAVEEERRHEATIVEALSS